MNAKLKVCLHKIGKKLNLRLSKYIVMLEFDKRNIMFESDTKSDNPKNKDIIRHLVGKYRLFKHDTIYKRNG